MLQYLLQLREHDRLGDEALDSSLRDLRPPMNVEETSPKQEKEIKEEPYDELVYARNDIS